MSHAYVAQLFYSHVWENKWCSNSGMKVKLKILLTSPFYVYIIITSIL